MAFDLPTVTAYIAGISMAGIKVKDLDGVKGAADPREMPLLYPDVTKLWEGLGLERNSQGPGTMAQQTLRYLLRYRLLYAPAGSERDLITIFPDLAAKVKTIITALVKNDVPADPTIDLRLNRWSQAGTVSDPAGNQCHGCDFELSVVEFVN